MAQMRCLLPLLALLVALPAQAQTPPIFEVAWTAPLVQPATNAWKPRERGGVVLSPSGTYLYAAATSGLHAFVTRSGAPLWKLTTTERVDGLPVIFDGNIYAATMAGVVHAANALTGKPIWDEPARTELSVQSPLAADARHVYIAADPGVLIALHRDSGKPSWRYNGDVGRDFLVEGQGGALVIGSLVYLGTPGGKLVALSARDGGLTWSIALDRGEHGPYTDVDTTPVRVARPGGDWLLAASHSGGLHAVTAAEGNLVWHYESEGLGAPQIEGDRIYVMSALGQLHVLDLATGQRIFARKVGGNVAGTLVLAPGGIALVPCELGLDAVSLSTGRDLSRAGNEFGFSAPPRVWGQYAYAVSNGGILYALALR